MEILSQAKRKRGNESIDRISDLHESLIYHIFSFLPFKTVVSTSALSKQWECLWKSSPIIDFGEWPSSYTTVGWRVKTFMEYVERALYFEEDHPPSIRRFCFQRVSHCEKYKVTELLCKVMERKVEELVLIGGGIIFPFRLFACESLTMLELEMSFFDIPGSVYLPKLKILRLKYVKFQDEHLIKRLLSGSPMLEELSLIECKWNDLECLCIVGPNLKRLFINGSSNRNSVVKINAPNLQTLKYSQVLAKDFVLHKFSTLHDADIVLSSPAERRKKCELGNLAIKLFATLSNAKRLTISDSSLKVLSHQYHFHLNLPSFDNLIHLEVMSSSFYFGNDCRDKGNLPNWIVGILLDFLNISPKLESLIFAEGFLKSNSRNDWSLNSVPPCLLLSLKSVEFHGYCGKKIDKDLIRFFLKNAKVLQRVRITISGKSCLSKNSNSRKKV